MLVIFILLSVSDLINAHDLYIVGEIYYSVINLLNANDLLMVIASVFFSLSFISYMFIKTPLFMSYTYMPIFIKQTGLRTIFKKIFIKVLYMFIKTPLFMSYTYMPIFIKQTSLRTIFKELFINVERYLLI